jgi:hypothetical protein
MKVGTLTFHSADNYGAMLQAYALPVAIRSLGHDCRVIDYRGTVTSGVEVVWPTQLIREHGLLRGAVKAANRWRLGWFDPKRKDVKFNRFMEKMLPLSEKTFRTPEEVATGDYDAVVFGSDQIWNTKITGADAPLYFGKGISGRKIAYAASSGTDTVPEALRPLLGDFSALGIRETGLTQTLRQQGLPAQTVLDPVLLLTAEEWRTVEAPLPEALEPGKYILIYTFDEQPVYDLARKIAMEENLPMVIVRWCGAHERFSDMIQLPDCGPREFLTLIDKAAVVCTSSFHGTAFSVLFGKRFYCCTPAGFGSRTNSLLEQVGLTAHRVEDLSAVAKVGACSVAEKLEPLRKASLKFLKDALESE